MNSKYFRFNEADLGVLTEWTEAFGRATIGFAVCMPIVAIVTTVHDGNIYAGPGTLFRLIFALAVGAMVGMSFIGMAENALRLWRWVRRRRVKHASDGVT